MAELQSDAIEVEVELTWRPYFLSPRLPVDGVDKRASYLKVKKNKKHVCRLPDGVVLQVTSPLTNEHPNTS